MCVGALGGVAGTEPAPGSSGIGAATAGPVTVARLSTVDEARIVTLARTVVMARKASHSRAAAPGSAEIGKHFPATQRNEALIPIV
jgi:hypothetical protein